MSKNSLPGPIFSSKCLYFYLLYLNLYIPLFIIIIANFCIRCNIKSIPFWGGGAYGYPITLAQFVEKTILSPLKYFCTFVKSQLVALVWFSTLFYWSMGLSLYQHCTALVTVCVLGHLVVSNSLQLMDCSPPDSSVHGISKARILEWVAISYSRGSSLTRD